MTRKPGPEAQLLKGICELLDCMNILWFRMNSGTQVVRDGLNKTRVIRLQKPGTADILAAPRCGISGMLEPIFFWIETKAPGGKQTPAQKSFQNQVEAQDHVYVLAYSIDDVLNKLHELGIR